MGGTYRSITVERLIEILQEMQGGAIVTTWTDYPIGHATETVIVTECEDGTVHIN